MFRLYSTSLSLLPSLPLPILLTNLQPLISTVITTFCLLFINLWSRCALFSITLSLQPNHPIPNQPHFAYVSPTCSLYFTTLCLLLINSPSCACTYCQLDPTSSHPFYLSTNQPSPTLCSVPNRLVRILLFPQKKPIHILPIYDKSS